MKILRRFEKSDLYNGMIAASDANKNHIYELRISDTYLSYRAIAFIEPDGSIVKCKDRGWFGTRLYSSWCETEESRKLDPVSRREDKLKELGI
jgi:hypothetical protein